MQFKSSCAPAAGPVTDWRHLSACSDADPELFFGPDGESPAAARLREAAARTVCFGCPVLRECRTWALSVRIPYGVWGGLGQDERDDVLMAGAGVAS